MKELSDNLATYLNNHLAGSTGLLELLEHLPQTEAGKNIEPFLVELRSEVVADRQTLEGVMERAQIDKARHQRATAWLAEKVGRLKLRADDSGDGTLQLLEALELVEIGIEGKRELWRSLAAIGDEPFLEGTDVDHLIQRAEKQHRRVEDLRIGIAKRAFVIPGGWQKDFASALNRPRHTFPLAEEQVHELDEVKDEILHPHRAVRQTASWALLGIILMAAALFTRGVSRRRG